MNSSIGNVPRIALLHFPLKSDWIFSNYSSIQNEIQKLISQQEVGVVTLGTFPMHYQYIYRIPKKQTTIIKFH